jgi:type I restriction enzyme S subunit
VAERTATRVAFGDVVRLSKERTSDPDADGFHRYVGLEHIDPGDLRIRRWGDVADGTTFTNVFRPGQVLFGKRRAYQRKVAVANFEGVCSGDIYVLEPKDPTVLLPELLPFICQTEAFFEHAVGTSAGSLSPRTNWSNLANFEFELLNAKRQQSVLEILSSSLAAVEALRRVRRRLARLQESFGSQIFSDLDASQRSVRLREVVDDSAFGPRFSSRLYSDSEGVQVIRTTDFLADGLIDYSSPPSVVLPERMIDQHRLVDGDFLLSRSGEYAGMTRVFRPPPSAGVHYIPAAYLIRFRLSPLAIAAEFLHEYCESLIGKRALRGLTQGSAQPNISGESFLELAVPLPPRSDQDRVVEQLGVIRGRLHDTTRRFDSAHALMSALVERAFHGE